MIFPSCTAVGKSALNSGSAQPPTLITTAVLTVNLCRVEILLVYKCSEIWMLGRKSLVITGTTFSEKIIAFVNAQRANGKSSLYLLRLSGSDFWILAWKGARFHRTALGK